MADEDTDDPAPIEIGKGIFLGFIEYMEQERNKAYHQGLRDGIRLNKAKDNLKGTPK